MVQQMLLIDCMGYAELSINESAGGSCRFQGKFQEANKVNKNKRLYTFETLNNNVEKLIEAVKNRGLFGELDHPTDSIVHLANASHLITRLWWEGNTLMGEGEILDTPAGKCLKALINGGSRIGISSRGVGNGQVNNEGVLVIGESYKLITFDAVADPSTFAAFQTKVTNKNEDIQFNSINSVNSVIREVKENKMNANTLISLVGLELQKQISDRKKK